MGFGSPSRQLILVAAILIAVSLLLLARQIEGTGLPSPAGLEGSSQQIGPVAPSLIR
jgi:hypothetical protein